MQWTAILATALGTILGVVSTLMVDQFRWRRETSERDRDALRASFTEYLTAIAKARDAFSKAEPAPEQVGKGHIVVGEYGVYVAQQQLELVAREPVIDMAGQTTLAVLDFHDVVASGHSPDSTDYVQSWRKLREARRTLINSMRTSLQRR